MKDGRPDEENGGGKDDLTELAKAVNVGDVTTGDLRKAARSTLTRLMECLDNPEGGRTPTGARQYATVLGILIDKLEKKTGDPRAESYDRLPSMSDAELEAMVIEDSARMSDGRWDKVIEARRKWKAAGGDGGSKEESLRKRKESKHWYQKEEWEFESE